MYACWSKSFCKIDSSKDECIEVTELLTFLKLERSAFNIRVFTLFDKDRSKQIDFSEFVIALWNWCTLSNNALESFAFDLYDNDGSGRIEVGREQSSMVVAYRETRSP